MEIASFGTQSAKELPNALLSNFDIQRRFTMDKAARIRKAFADGDGVIRMVPNFVPRSFNQPGRRLKLHPDDYYAKGMDRGAITER